jgi:mannose-6-phosphate isomerase-like protein (cupin superfamily)
MPVSCSEQAVSVLRSEDVRPDASRCRRISLRRIDEPRGSLCVAEVGHDIPFKIERAYWISDVPVDGMRANHAHREQSELLVAARGAFTVHCDEGDIQLDHRLDSPDEALLLPPKVFHYLDSFAPGSLCLVLASGPYDPGEYVNDYAEFSELIAQQ